MFIARPWIGLGLGTFMFNFKKFIAEDYKFTASYAHNCYLQMASELGIIGLLAFLSILGLFFYHGIKALNRGRGIFTGISCLPPRPRYLATACRWGWIPRSIPWTWGCFSGWCWGWGRRRLVRLGSVGEHIDLVIPM